MNDTVAQNVELTAAELEAVQGGACCRVCVVEDGRVRCLHTRTSPERCRLVGGRVVDDSHCRPLGRRARR